LVFVEHAKLYFKFPLYDNDGHVVSPEEFAKIKKYFISNFKALSKDHPSEGWWKDKETGIIFHDRNVEYTIFIEKHHFEKEVMPHVNEYVIKFKEQFIQLEIFCYYHNVMRYKP
jgi:hypothetical protein